jgi:hypothetical protein
MPKLDTTPSAQPADSASPLTALEQELATREAFLATLTEKDSEGYRVHAEIVANLKRQLAKP